MKLRLINTKQELSDVKTFIFEASEPVAWEAGQYMHYVFPHDGEDDRGHERWFTISSAPYEGHITITTRFAPEHSSSFKKALKELQVGQEIEADGPKGKFIMDDPAKKHIFIAGGIGITPYRSMLLQLDHDNKPINVELLYANRDENFVFGDELAALMAKHPSFKIRQFVGERHIEESDLKPYADDPENNIYVSGPEPMVEAFEEMLKTKLGVPEERVKLDFFPGYPAQ